MRDPNLITEEAMRHFCQPPAASTDIPLRVRRALAPAFLADSEFKQVPTEELLELARARKHVYVTDRASAIAVLKGMSRVTF